ncbi:MAG: NlpC/P60 family protein [Erysipelotrichaceae bacterium]|nr:NlpC/P60 family protein [Erysipelotrichaceae bacterium]
MPDEMDYELLVDWLIDNEPFSSQISSKGFTADDLLTSFEVISLLDSSSDSEVDVSSVSGLGNKIVTVAKSKLGCRYWWGKSGPDYFDCSGFVYYCLKQAGVSVSRLTASGYASSSSFTTISYSQLQAGDLITFS